MFDSRCESRGIEVKNPLSLDGFAVVKFVHSTLLLLGGVNIVSTKGIFARDAGVGSRPMFLLSLTSCVWPPDLFPLDRVVSKRI